MANLAVGEVYQVLGASLVAQMVKNLPAMQETQVGYLGGEDPLEKGMATHSSILAWRIPWTEEAGRLQSMGPQSQTQLSTTQYKNVPDTDIVIRDRVLNRTDIFSALMELTF